MTVSRLEWDVLVFEWWGSLRLPVSTGTINIDDQNIPAITADVMVPFDETFIEYVDPRQTPAPRVILTGTRTDWASQPLSAVTKYAISRGNSSLVSTAALSTAWASLDIVDVSRLFGAPLHGLAEDEPQTWSLDLHIRELSYDDWTMTISLASDEALLTDWAITTALDYTTITDNQVGMNVQQVQTYIDPVLLAVLGKPTVANVYNTTALSDTAANVVSWRQDMTAWELMRMPLEDTDLKLRVSGDGKSFSLQRPENSIRNPASVSHLFTEEDVISARQVFTRTSDWYDSAMITQGDGLAFTFAAYPTSGKHSRTYTERFPDGTKLTTSMASNITKRSLNRGRFIDIEAPIRLNVFMTDEFTYIPAGASSGPEYQWRVKSVSYDLFTATMRIRGERRY